MPRDVEKPNFREIPLTGLRGLTPEWFEDLDLPDGHYVYEDVNTRPITQPINHDTIFKRSVNLPQVENIFNGDVIKLGNENLPIYNYKDEILEAIRENSYVGIKAETGSGKSTQLIQYLLEDGELESIFLTQPRRAAARNVYERVCTEIDDKKGSGASAKSVRFQNGGEKHGPDDAVASIVTDGLQVAIELSRKDKTSKIALIIDEIHEWNPNIEALIVLAKRLIEVNPNFKVIGSSATMDAEGLANYFADVCDKQPPVIEVEGRNFNIIKTEEPDSTVVEQTVIEIEKMYLESKYNDTPQNAILVFLPGVREIKDCLDQVSKLLSPDIANSTTLLKLHAKMPVNEQQACFQKYEGVKVIFSTNVAQTSLTIPDVGVVIDSGLERRIEIKDGVQGLERHPTSKADCDQRAGRAGRVSDGRYILTKLDEDTPHVQYISRDDYGIPAILRTDIVRNTLLFAGAGLDIAKVGLYHPIGSERINDSLNTLRMLGAVDENNEITNLGKKMNKFPLMPQSARMMVEALNHSELIRAYMSAIVSAREVGGLQNFMPGSEKRWKDLSDETTSDLLTQLDIFIAIQGMNKDEMKEFDLDINNVERANEHYFKIAKRSKAQKITKNILLPPSQEERETLKQCILAGSVNSIYRSIGDGNFVKIDEPNGIIRRESNRTTVTQHSEIKVGTAFRVEYYLNGDRKEKHIFQDITNATIQAIGRVATHLSVWESADLVPRPSGFVEKRRLKLFGVDLGIEDTVPAQPSPKLREKILYHVIDKPGSYQVKLRSIKRNLEELDNMAKDPVKQLTHSQILALVSEATPDDVTDPSIVDNNLRLIMQERGINLNYFVDKERRELIIQNSPEVIEIDGIELNLIYRKHKPLVKEIDEMKISLLNDDIFLKDGRMVHFLDGNKYLTLIQLQEKLSRKT